MKKVLFAVIGLFAAIQESHAQAALEGTARYRMTRYANRISTEGSASRVSNYNTYPIRNAQLIVGLSKKRFTPGKSLSGYTIARSSTNTMLPRTYYENVRFHGEASLRVRGSYNVVLLLIDGSRSIKAGLNFKNKISFGQSWRARAFHRHIERVLAAERALLETRSIKQDAYWVEP